MRTILPLFAAARVLQSYDAARIGLDWPTELVKVFEPVLKGDAPAGVADAAADVLLAADVFGDPEAARLRVLVAAAGFEAGWTPADFAALAPAAPRFMRMLSLGDDWLRGHEESTESQLAEVVGRLIRGGYEPFAVWQQHDRVDAARVPLDPP